MAVQRHSAPPGEEVLGSSCTVRLYAPTSLASKKDLTDTGNGTLLEVRRLWLPSLSASTQAKLEPTGPGDRDEAHLDESRTLSSSTVPLKSEQGQKGVLKLRRALPQEGPLYGFVRLKDADHRLSGWFPLYRIRLKDTAARTPTQAPPQLSSSAGVTYVSAEERILRPILSTVYKEVTPGMARTQRAMKQLDYLEERLLRDCRTPTTIRYFVYLNSFLFAPWYFAPYGLLHREYDPMLPYPASEMGPRSSTAAVTVNPYIKDAFLCPFSLRVYTTCDQLRYETQTYRKGFLHPPGQQIYHDAERGISLFEVNGSQHVTYCRHLFLVGKSFLENKLAGHDVQNYYFYVLCLHHRFFPDYIDDPSAMYFAGYFTWEKQVVDCNLACIVTLPCFAGGSRRRCGSALKSDLPRPPVPSNLGQFMIAVSYELAYRRRQVGTPEKPLSDLGALAYQRFWRQQILKWMSDKVAELEASQQGRVTSSASSTWPHKGTGQGHSGSKRPRDTDNDEDGVDGREGRFCGVGAEAMYGDDGLRTTIKEIAAAVKLEDADVVKTIHGMGLLHRNADDRSIRLVLPRQYVQLEQAMREQQDQDIHCAVFRAAMLKPKSSTTSR